MSIAEAAPTLRELAETSNAWPFEEARKIVARLKRKPKDEVIFETGYGPSGLPHIGTFGEVARTTMVRHAFRVLTDDKVKTRLIAFSDDMDGLRKVPDNVPNKDMLAAHLGKPLTQVPDPFSNEYPSFGAHNNARLRAFLDRFGFEYEFLSSTDCYKSGRFDGTLLLFLQRFDAVMNIMLPSLREERAQTYSPFLPIHPKSGIVMQVPVEPNAAKGTILWSDPDTGERFETPVTGGHAKLQWKPDWAMRWVALGIDYEMAGKDLIELGEAVGRDRARTRRAAAGRFQLRALPRREGPEDLQVEGQRAHHRGMAALREPGVALAVHVPESEVGEAAVLRRDSARGRRLSAIPRRLSAPGREAAAVQSGVAHPFGTSPEGGHAGDVPASAHAGVVVERRECRDAVGLHRPLPARRHAADASEARRDGRLRDQLLSRLRRADEDSFANRPTASARR